MSTTHESIACVFHTPGHQRRVQQAWQFYRAHDRARSNLSLYIFVSSKTPLQYLQIIFSLFTSHSSISMMSRMKHWATEWLESVHCHISVLVWLVLEVPLLDDLVWSFGESSLVSYVSQSEDRLWSQTRRRQGNASRSNTHAVGI